MARLKLKLILLIDHDTRLLLAYPRDISDGNSEE